ncbi:MAG: cadherin-like domain-containing protein, partial [Thermoplasmata archaeon]|nr:cadherin-like domain-containing protein [Thermoplasmata archaeon]
WAPDSPYNDGNRAHITISNNEFIDTGRVGIVTHDWVDVTVNQNIFYKTVDDFGYAMEMGSASTGQITHNTIYNYDTPAAIDGSSASGIYIENSFTTGITGVTKTVVIEDNDIYGCQYGLIIGNQWSGYAGDVDIVVTLNNNQIHDSHASSGIYHGGVIITDEGKDVGSSVTVHSHGNTISNNGPDGGYFIYADDNGAITATIEEDTFINNGVDGDDAGGIYVNDYGTPSIGSSYDVTVNYCIFSGNLAYGIQNDYVGTTIHAAYNYWGDASGPYHPTKNPSGLGDSVSDNVDFNPWTAWSVTLNFIESVKGKQDTAVFGEAPDATDGNPSLPDSYDVPKPGEPPAPYLYVWFEAGYSAPYNRLWKDYKLYPETLDKIWTLKVIADTSGPTFDTTDITITWDKTKLASTEYRDVDLYLDTLQIADMLAVGTVTFAATPGAVNNLQIKCHVNQLPTSADKTVTKDEDNPYTFLLSDFAFTDPDTAVYGDQLEKVKITQLETDGSLTLSGSDVSLDQEISRADIDAGNLRFTPDPNENGNPYANFKFKVSDGLLYSASDYTMTIKVNAVNDNPDAVDDTVSLPEDSVAYEINVLANDVDIDVGDVLSISAVGTPSHGTAAIDGVKIDYTPTSNYVGTDEFTYTISDGNGGSDTATVHVTVTNVNDNPDAVDDTVSLPEDSVAYEIN